MSAFDNPTLDTIGAVLWAIGVIAQIVIVVGVLLDRDISAGTPARA